MYSGCIVREISKRKWQMGTLFCFRYEQLYKCIVDLLDVAGGEAKQRREQHGMNYVQLCAAQYEMCGAWRLFLSLPPSLHALDNLNSHPLLLCVLLPRLSHRNLSAWIKDGEPKFDHICYQYLKKLWTNLYIYHLVYRLIVGVSKQLEGADPSETLERAFTKFSGSSHEITLLANLIARLESDTWTTTDLFWLEVVLGKLQHSFNHIGMVVITMTLKYL